jgi:hypothetical protein
MFHVELIKLDFLEYLLTAKGDNHLERCITYLPFEEDQAARLCEQALVIRHHEGVVTELNLVPGSGDYSTHGSGVFEQHWDVNRVVLYMYNIKRCGKEYHVEVTRQCSDERHLSVYVLCCTDVHEKQSMRVDIFVLDSAYSSGTGGYSDEEKRFLCNYMQDNLSLQFKEKHPSKVHHL